LSFGSTPRLLEEGEAVARVFLDQAEVPRAGAMVGTPHTHTHPGEDDGAHGPVFPRGLGRVAT